MNLDVLDADLYGSLVVPGAAGQYAAQARFEPGGARLSVGEQCVLLPWADDGWRFDAWQWTRYGGRRGLAVRARSGWRSRLEPLAAACRRHGDGLTGWYGPADLTLAVSVPLVRRRVLTNPGLCGVMDGLREALRVRPALRPALGTSASVDRLLMELPTGPHARYDPFGGLESRRTLAVAVTLYRRMELGGDFVLGRPVAGDRLPHEADLVERVLRRLDNPYDRDLRLTREQVAHRVHELFLDVTPWPFGALQPIRPAPVRRT